MELVAEKFWISNQWQGSISSMKIKPRDNTDSIKCTRTVHTICIAVRWHGSSNLQMSWPTDAHGCQTNNKGNALILNPLIIIYVSQKLNTDLRCVNRLFTQTFASSVQLGILATHLSHIFWFFKCLPFHVCLACSSETWLHY